MTNEQQFYDLQIDVLNLEGSADWRRRKAEEYPEDAQRNLEAAQLLEWLAVEVGALEGSEIHRRLGAAVDKCDDLSRFSEEWSDYVRRIGFSTFPDNGQQLLNDMLSTMLAGISEDVAH